MAVTQITYNPIGSPGGPPSGTTLFGFPFEYLETTDIKVSLDGSVTTAYTFAHATQIQLNTAPDDGVVVRIYRDTDDTALAARFYPGSAIRSQDLNNNFDQSLYVAQETSTQVDNFETYVEDTYYKKTDLDGGQLDNRYYTQSELASPYKDGGALDTRYPQVLSNKFWTYIVGEGSAWDDLYDDFVPTTERIDERFSELKSSGYWDDRYFTEAELTPFLPDSSPLDTRYPQDLTSADNTYIVGLNYPWPVGTEGLVPTTKRIDQRIEAEKNNGYWDDRYYTKALIDGGELDDLYINRVWFRTSDLSLSNSDLYVPSTKYVNTYFYNKTEADDRFWNVNTGEYYSSADAWTPNDTHIATTAAIENRIITLVDQVGGFVPVATHLTFPTTNPDVNDDVGTVVSLGNITGLTHSSGTSTNATTTGGTPVTITGIPASLPSPATSVGMLVVTTGTLNTYTFHRLTPEVNDVVAVANNTTNINTVAGQISPVNRIKTIYDNINSVTTTADNISSVGTVAGSIANVGTVATNITRVNSVGSSINAVNAVYSSLGAVGTVAANVSSVQTVSGSIANVNATGGSIANVNTVATNIADVNTVATDIADVTAVSTNIGAIAAVGSDLANSFSNISDYGGIGIDDDVTSTAGTSDIQTVADNIANVNTVSGISGNVTTVAGIAGNVTSVAGNSSNINTVATDIANVNTNATNIANINTVAGISANVTTVAGNTANINSVVTNLAAIIAAPTEAADAASSAAAALASETAAASSASAAATSASNASTSATNAATSASAAATSAAAALVSEQNADASEAQALQYRDDTAGLLAQAGSDAYNVNTNQSWGDIITGAVSHFANEVLADVLLTMSTGTNTYNYGTII